MNAVSRFRENRIKANLNGYIAGVDEAGIGTLAGPVVAASVILSDVTIPGLDDSKKLTKKQRNHLFAKILTSSISIGVGIVDNVEIDKINILSASLKAMRIAVESMSIKPSHVIVDGIRTIPGLIIPQTSIKHGDGFASSIAAASIIAKVMRDMLMEDYDKLYPNHGFSVHKGYGTFKHMKALKIYGTTAIHRLSYGPVRESLKVKGLLLHDAYTAKFNEGEGCGT